MPLSIQPDDLLHESPAIVVLNKPGGVLTQAPPGIDSMEHRVQQWLAATRPEPYVGCLHRLDRPVSGCLAFGLSRRATRHVAGQFESREVRKTYWAIIAGTPEQDQGTLRDFMRKVPDEPRSELVGREHPEAKEAILDYRVLGRGGGWSWLEISLQTGRTHQIRLQCSGRLGPVLGDAQYGSEIPFGPPRDDERERWIALHARSLEYFDPALKQRISCVAPLPPAWTGLAAVFDGLLT